MKKYILPSIVGILLLIAGGVAMFCGPEKEQPVLPKAALEAKPADPIPGMPPAAVASPAQPVSAEEKPPVRE